jgi:predicted amidohydrolase
VQPGIDPEFPEGVRTVALRGADPLCAPVNRPFFPRPDGERPVEVVRVHANAAINRIFVAACDRAGPERGVSWVGGSAGRRVGGSVVVGPDGHPAANPPPGYDGGTLIADCLLADARDKRLSERDDVFADRRPELYRSILRSAPSPGSPTDDRTTRHA